MAKLYVNEDSANISISDRCVKVRYNENYCSKIPVETLESVSIFGKAQMTTQCMVECLKRGIPISYYSRVGSYFGQLESTGHVRVERQRMQCRLYDSEFALELGKRIMQAKIRNQEVVLSRYWRRSNCSLSEEMKMMRISERKIVNCNNIDQLIGYEGTAARYYFQGLSKLVDDPFKFQGRSRRPPKDEFNSMLSLGYSILMNEIYGKIQVKGLNPYFGFIHRDREKHPTLVSDLMEEWRAVIVDSMVMSLANGHEILLEDFQHNATDKAYYLTNKGMQKFIKKFDKKLCTETKYLKYVEYQVSFRRAMDLQIEQLIKAMESEDASLYQPVQIR